MCLIFYVNVIVCMCALMARTLHTATVLMYAASGGKSFTSTSNATMLRVIIEWYFVLCTLDLCIVVCTIVVSLESMNLDLDQL